MQLDPLLSRQPHFQRDSLEALPLAEVRKLALAPGRLPGLTRAQGAERNSQAVGEGERAPGSGAPQARRAVSRPGFITALYAVGWRSVALRWAKLRAPSPWRNCQVLRVYSRRDAWAGRRHRV